MNKFAMDAALPIAGEMELIIEIDAPKIVIPDDCFRDSGCLLADTGYLVIKGKGFPVTIMTIYHMQESFRCVSASHRNDDMMWCFVAFVM
jgi:hypothetical protein